MYLILLFELLNIMDYDFWRINWNGIDFCVFVVEFMKKNVWLSVE